MDRKILEENLRKVLWSIREVARECDRNPEEIKLVIVTKGQPIETVSLLKNLGYVDFGESYLKEFSYKADHIHDIDWHFIGRFYRRQVKKIVGIAEYIHSVASLKHLEKVDHIAKSKGITQKAFLQVNVSADPKKQGFQPDELLSICKRHELSDYLHVSFMGLMTIAPQTSSKNLVRKCFRNLRELRDKINEIDKNFQIKDLSMGMSSDYLIAIREGSTVLRIGQAILGSMVVSKPQWESCH